MEQTVFVVDDERLLADTIKAILRAEGYSVFGFYDPEDALQAAAQNTPDLLISDYNMPKINGLQLALKIVAMHHDCRVIIMSGVLPKVAPAAVSNTFKFLQKPI